MMSMANGESLPIKNDPMARTYWMGLYWNLSIATTVKVAAKSRDQKSTE